MVRKGKKTDEYEQSQEPKEIISDISDKNIIQRKLRSRNQFAETMNNDTLYNVFMTKLQVENDIPNSYKQAWNSKDWSQWKKAIFEEYDSILDKGVFEIKPKGWISGKKSIINTRWVFSNKLGLDGILSKYKARCVARGFKQIKGID